jgi:hypothetical protein
MAAAANPPDLTRPRWTVGFAAGMSLFGVSSIAEFLAALSGRERVTTVNSLHIINS